MVVVLTTMFINVVVVVMVKVVWMGLDVVGKVVCDRCKKTEYVPAMFDSIKGSFAVKIIDEVSCRVFALLKQPEGWVEKYGLVLCPDCAKAFEEFMSEGTAKQESKP